MERGLWINLVLFWSTLATVSSSFSACRQAITKDKSVKQIKSQVLRKVKWCWSVSLSSHANPACSSTLSPFCAPASAPAPSSASASPVPCSCLPLLLLDSPHGHNPRYRVPVKLFLMIIPRRMTSYIVAGLNQPPSRWYEPANMWLVRTS